MSQQLSLPAWIQAHRRWLLLGMLVLLHLALIEGIPTPISRTLIVGHIGLFFLWQPFVRAERRLETRHFLALGLLLGAIELWLSWWLMIVWLVLVTGIIGGKVFLFERRAGRLFYLLALTYLLSVLLVFLVPKILPAPLAIDATFGSLALYVLPALFLVMALLRDKQEIAHHTEVVDFAYSIFVVLTLAVIVLGTISSMLLRGAGYIESLLQVMLIFGVVMLFLAWLWDPRGGFSGIGAIFSRYMLTIGLPFEQWVHALSEYAQRNDDPEEFLVWACNELVRLIPWISGGEWKTGTAAGSFGEVERHRSEFRHDQLVIVIGTRQALTPALNWHLHVVTQLLAEFYTARMRARKLRQLSYLQAIYETGARLTHDVKNLLQSLNTLCFAATEDGDEASPEFRALLQRQLPAIALRLQQTLEKLQMPAAESDDYVDAAVWWDNFRRHSVAATVRFVSIGDLAGAVLPVSLFDSAAENYLQNALDKSRTEPALQIEVRLDLSTGRPALSVADNGTAVPGKVIGELGLGPVKSENGLGIGIYQVARYAELFGYRFRLAANRAGEVRFALEPVAAANPAGVPQAAATA